MNEEQGKSALFSKGVQGSVVAAVGGILTYLQMSGVIQPETDLTPLISVIGGLWAFLGRVSATKKITSWF